MGLRRIDDGQSPYTSPAAAPCISMEHYPPTQIFLQPGRYEYTCPSCGKKTVFTVPSITC